MKPNTLSEKKCTHKTKWLINEHREGLKWMCEKCGKVFDYEE